MKNSWSVKTILRKDKEKKDGTFPLNYLIIINSKSVRLPVGESLKKTEWDDNNNCPRKKGKLVDLKNILEKRKQQFNDFFIEQELAGKPLNITQAKLFYHGEKDKDFYCLFDKFCERKFKTIKPGTQYHYKLFKKQLKEYQPCLSLIEINYKFITEFLHYLSSDKKVGASGIATRRKIFCTILEEFVRLELIKSNPCKRIKKPKENVREEFLTKKELNAFATVNLNIGKLSNGLNHTRDLFLFGCFTGLRYSDLINLRKDQIIGGRIEVEMQKTGKKVKIPLNKEAKEIINKFKSIKSGNRVFPFRCNVSVNRDLKFIARRAHINKRVSFHTARHTFGSMLASNNVQPFYIMKLMGHSDMRMTARYVNSKTSMLEEAMKAVNFR
ncbi:site-specific integrase [Gramella sp. MAR_2010_147]|uniref:site-specific integrase n=1 Tax=Gramella sp. MAR_2010_147 TaxID=1250205 RepID=UPI000879C37F|nr:site-specific integrase [Gramella sp. MAR_2010_147]SDS06336.1 Site-specific recombinase XerD [Gramella sp. MAR_2010_147]